MNDKNVDQNTFRTYQLMNEIEAGTAVSQRELASRLGVAVGLVNSYLKNFVSKGYIRVKNYPRNRYAYLLTPKGLAEKSRLALHHFNYFTGLYTLTRGEYLKLFKELKCKNVEMVVFCGADEVTEIAYLSLQEVGLELVGIYDDTRQGTYFLGKEVLPVDKLHFDNGTPVIISTLKQQDEINQKLDDLACPIEQVYSIPFRSE